MHHFSKLCYKVWENQDETNKRKQKKKRNKEIKTRLIKVQGMKHIKYPRNTADKTYYIKKKKNKGVTLIKG